MFGLQEAVGYERHTSPQVADLKAPRFIEYDNKPSGDSTLHKF